MPAVKTPQGDVRRPGRAAAPRSSSPLPRYVFDQEYVQRLTAGDPETEAHFCAYFGDLLTIKLRARLRSAALVEDARQETFMRVLSTLRAKGGLVHPERLGAFVNGVCNNVLFETYRSESRAVAFNDDHPEPPDVRASVETLLSDVEQRGRVRRIIADLPQKDRDLLRWLFFEDRNKDDVCRELRIDREYLRVLVHRAKQRFKALFEDLLSSASAAS